MRYAAADRKRPPVGPPLKHDSSVIGATWNHDESLVLTWSKDNTARLWRARDGTPVGLPFQHDDTVLGASFNPDESRILTWSWDNTARLWNAKADVDFPQEALPLLVEVMTGTTMDDAGNITMLTPDQWQQRKRAYIDIAERHLTKCRYQDVNLFAKQKPHW